MDSFFYTKGLIMKEIYPNLYIGNDRDCLKRIVYSNLATIHACKSCHKMVLEYKMSLPNNHPNYLTFERGRNLYLNLVDMSKEFLPQFTNPIFDEAFDFISEHINKRRVLIHCNKGESRSPSLGLVYLARNGVIKNDDFVIAALEFMDIYPNYRPGEGIRAYMKKNWDYLMRGNLQRF